MGVRYTDAELSAFLSSFRATSDDPHQDFGDVGHLIEDIEDHMLIEELIAARMVVDAVRADERLLAIGPVEGSRIQAPRALRVYDELFGDQQQEV